jgi:hypothetical protein
MYCSATRTVADAQPGDALERAGPQCEYYWFDNSLLLEAGTALHLPEVPPPASAICTAVKPAIGSLAQA